MSTRVNQTVCLLPVTGLIWLYVIFGGPRPSRFALVPAHKPTTPTPHPKCYSSTTNKSRNSESLVDSSAGSHLVSVSCDPESSTKPQTSLSTSSVRLGSEPSAKGDTGTPTKEHTGPLSTPAEEHTGPLGTPTKEHAVTLSTPTEEHTGSPTKEHTGSPTKEHTGPFNISTTERTHRSSHYSHRYH